jgi:hypothetical protein
VTRDISGRRNAVFALTGMIARIAADPGERSRPQRGCDRASVAALTAA